MNGVLVGQPLVDLHIGSLQTHILMQLISHPIFACIHLISLYNRIIGYTQRTDNAHVRHVHSESSPLYHHSVMSTGRTESD